MLKKIFFKQNFFHSQKIRCFSTLNNKFATITTPIFYLNADPHIGHLYSLLLADCIYRWHIFKGFNAILTTGFFIFIPFNAKPFLGTDEHGQKVHQAAIEKKIAVEEFCKLKSEKFRSLNQNFNVNPTKFIRTSEGFSKKIKRKNLLK